MGSLSYQEKSLYGELVADAAVFLPYFVLIHRPQQLTVGLIAGYILVLIVAQIVLQTIIAIVTRDRRTDERDRLVRLRGYRAAYFTVVGAMTLGMAALWVHSMAGELPLGHMALHFLSVFFAVLMLAEIVKTVTQLVAYRRSI